MGKETGAAFLITIVAGALIWWHTKRGWNNATVLDGAGGVVPEAAVSNLPNGTYEWFTPYYLRANFPSNRNLGSDVVPSTVNDHLNMSFMAQQIPPSI